MGITDRGNFIRPWPTAFQRVGAEPWVIHGPKPLRPGPQRTWTESASWKAEGTAVSSRAARAKKGQIEERNRTVRANRPGPETLAEQKVIQMLVPRTKPLPIDDGHHSRRNQPTFV